MCIAYCLCFFFKNLITEYILCMICIGYIWFYFYIRSSPLYDLLIDQVHPKSDRHSGTHRLCGLKIFFLFFIFTSKPGVYEFFNPPYVTIVIYMSRQTKCRLARISKTEELHSKQSADAGTETSQFGKRRARCKTYLLYTHVLHNKRCSLCKYSAYHHYSYQPPSYPFVTLNIEKIYLRIYCVSVFVRQSGLEYVDNNFLW